MLAMFSGLLLVSRIPIAKASESQRSCVPCRRCRQYGELRRQLQVPYSPDFKAEFLNGFGVYFRSIVTRLCQIG